MLSNANESRLTENESPWFIQKYFHAVRVTKDGLRAERVDEVMTTIFVFNLF